MTIAVHDVLAVSIDYQGRYLDFEEAHIWHVSNGMVSEMWAIPKDPYEFDAFFAD